MYYKAIENEIIPEAPRVPRYLDRGPWQLTGRGSEASQSETISVPTRDDRHWDKHARSIIRSRPFLLIFQLLES